MMISANNIQQWIEAGLPGSKVRAMGDDGAHFEAIVISGQFEGKPKVQRHRMVYAALGEHMQAVHALSLKTLTPEEADA